MKIPVCARFLIIATVAWSAAAWGADGDSATDISGPADLTPPPEPFQTDVIIDHDRLPMAEIVRTDTAPTIDGVLNEPLWESAAVLNGFLQTEPVEGGTPSEHTTVLICYDTDHLYIAFRCDDSDPDAINATQMKRDGSLSSDDYVYFIIDPTFDRRNAYFFEINPLGARGDALIEESTRFRKDWDGVWFGRSTINEHGWTAEIALPFKTISFNPDTTRWSFNAARFIRRHNEHLRWASPSRNTSFNSVADAGVIEGIRDIKQGKGIDFKPYAVSTFKRDHEGDRNGVDIDAGFDVFFKLTPSLTLAATVNTDFAETEVDERKINLTRFPLFFPEKRDFFLQDAGIFEFGGIRRNPLPFHSRRIGLGASGETIDILAGMKLTGRTGDWNIGLLDVETKAQGDLAARNLFVGRVSKNVLEQSTVGAIFTGGDPRSNDDSWTGGVDFNYRHTLDDDQNVTGHLWGMKSDTMRAGRGRDAYGFKLGYPNDRISWSMGYSHIDEDFNAMLGFVPRRGIREYYGNWRYRWRPESDWIRTIDSSVYGSMTTNLDHDVESGSVNLELFEINTHAGDEVGMSITRNREVLTDSFEISEGVVVPEGDYRWNRMSTYLRSSRGRPVDVMVRVATGDFYTGVRTDYRASLAWRPSCHMNMGLEYELNDIDLDEGDFLVRVIRSRLNIYFNPDLSWSTFAQYDNLSESIGINSRVRWIITPGNEIFFVVNQAVSREEESYRVLQTEMTTKVGLTIRF